MKVRYGIISTANIVPRFIAGVAESSQGEVIAIAGRDLTKAEKFAAELNIPYAYDDYAAIYQHPEVDIVYIANYNGGHFAVAKAALEHGKNVLCEKPLCGKASEAKELFQIAREKNVFLMEAQKSVFLPVTQKVREIVRSGELGELLWVNVISCHTGAKRGAWFTSLANGGGILNGAGTYPLEFVSYVTGELIREISGVIQITPPISDDGCVFTGKLGRNTLVSVLITKDIVVPSRVEIYGTKGKITVPNYWKTESFTIEHGDEVREEYFPFTSEFVYEIEHVNECLIQGKKQSDAMTPELTLMAINAIDSLYQNYFENEEKGK